MTVAELIILLQQQDPTKDVHILMPSHNYWGTMLAPAVTEVTECKTRFSDYHNEVAVEDRDLTDYIKNVVVIGSAK